MSRLEYKPVEPRATWWRHDEKVPTTSHDREVVRWRTYNKTTFATYNNAETPPESLSNSTELSEDSRCIQSESQTGCTSSVSMNSVEDILDGIEKELKDYEKFTHQLMSKHTRNIRLVDLKILLEYLGEASVPVDQEYRYHCYLAWVHDYLGSYQQVHLHYRAALPQIFNSEVQFDIVSRQPGLNLPNMWFRKRFNRNFMQALHDYLSFLIETKTNLELAERIINALPWLTSAEGVAGMTDLTRPKFMLLKIRLLNAQRKYAGALGYLDRNTDGYLVAMRKAFDPIIFEREKVLALVGHAYHNNHAALSNAILSTLTLSIICAGAWHRQTLNVLYHFGRLFRKTGRQEKACRVLHECCTGFLHRFGTGHPDFLRAYDELQRCDQNGSALRALGRFESLDIDAQGSIAFEHVFINTVVDTLGYPYDTDIEKLGRILDGMYIDAGPFPSQRHRTMARCMEELGDTEAAIKALDAAPTKHTQQTWENLILDLDRVRIISGTASGDAVNSLVVDLLHDVRRLTDTKFDTGRSKAVCRKLSALGFMHFSPSSVVELMDEEYAEVLGRGTYAVVDSIKVGHELYARKSVVMPRFRQQQTRNAIQNELTNIRTLDHPHIIKVFFTYELDSRFFIVIEPLAEFDLEAFLLQQSSSPPTESQQTMVWKWLLCLSNTLAFIHSKNIRHKDIKSRNILVKGQDVIFADFGSSHAFLDSGDSTTDGPSCGHTKIYCAPEVTEHQKRSRSADIFSLGCVFTELAVWLAGQPDFDIKAWHSYRNVSDSASETNAYHVSLDKVRHWFDDCDNDLVRTLYHDVLGPMLSEDRKRRPFAPNVSREIQKLQRTTSIQIEPCKKCYLGLWIDDERFPIPTLVPQTEIANLATEKVSTQEDTYHKTVTPEDLEKLRIQES